MPYPVLDGGGQARGARQMEAKHEAHEEAHLNGSVHLAAKGSHTGTGNISSLPDPRGQVNAVHGHEGRHISGVEHRNFIDIRDDWAAILLGILTAWTGIAWTTNTVGVRRSRAKAASEGMNRDQSTHGGVGMTSKGHDGTRSQGSPGPEDTAADRPRLIAWEARHIRGVRRTAPRLRRHRRRDLQMRRRLVAVKYVDEVRRAPAARPALAASHEGSNTANKGIGRRRMKMLFIALILLASLWTGGGPGRAEQAATDQGSHTTSWPNDLRANTSGTSLGTMQPRRTRASDKGARDGWRIEEVNEGDDHQRHGEAEWPDGREARRKGLRGTISIGPTPGNATAEAPRASTVSYDYLGDVPSYQRSGDEFDQRCSSWSFVRREVPAVPMQLHSPRDPSSVTVLPGTDAVSVYGDLVHGLLQVRGQLKGRPPGTAVSQMHRAPESSSRTRLGCMESVAVRPRGRPRSRGGIRKQERRCDTEALAEWDEAYPGVRGDEGDVRRCDRAAQEHHGHADAEDDFMHEHVSRDDVRHFDAEDRRDDEAQDCRDGRDPTETDGWRRDGERGLQGGGDCDDVSALFILYLPVPTLPDSQCEIPATKGDRTRDEEPWGAHHDRDQVVAAPCHLRGRRETECGERHGGDAPYTSTERTSDYSVDHLEVQVRNRSEADDTGAPTQEAHEDGLNLRHFRRGDERDHKRAPWWHPIRRIGEASNPGPARIEPPSLPDIAARRLLPEQNSAIQYPRPTTGGSLGNVMAPGFSARAPTASGNDRIQLLIETVNSTGWTALKMRLVRTEAHALLAQETWITQAAVASASAWARRHGWRSIWSPATVTKKGGTSAGVAIFVRDYMGLHLPARGAYEVQPARAVAGIMEIPGRRPIHLTSCYLRHGGRAAEDNANTMALVGANCRAQGDDMVCVVGGDYNMSPEEMLGTGFDREAELTLFHDGSQRGTFRTCKAASTLDYFFVSDRLAPAVEAVGLIEASGIKGHLPVQLRFRPKLASLKALYLRPPPKLPTERVYGPIPAPPAWNCPAAVAEAALAGARARIDSDAVDDLLETAYAEWAYWAEEELQHYTGTCLGKRGNRGARPKLVWRSVVPERKFSQEYPRAATATWLSGIAGEVVRIARAAESAMRREQLPQHGTTRHSTETQVDLQDGMDEQAPEHEDDMGFDEMDPTCDHDDDGTGGFSQAERQRRRPPETQERCHAVIKEILDSMKEDAPDEVPDHDIATVWSKLKGTLNDAARTMDNGGGGHHDDRDGHHLRAPLAHGWHEDTAAAMATLATTATSLKDELANISAQADAAQRNDEARKWKDWILEDFGAGASRAHAATRIPQETMPVAAKTEGGAMSSAPEEMLDEQRRRFRELWRPAQRAFRYDWKDAGELPRVEAARLREVASTFAHRTSQTYDGFHPRLLAALSDDALEVLATLLQAVEVSGRWPRQIGLVVSALLPKAKGGFRPIGILPGVYRLWAKARRDVTDRWEEKHARGYLSAAKGNGPADTMWRMAMRHEEGTAAGNEAGVIAEDLAAFFETVDRQILMQEAHALDFPLPVLRAALGMYAAPRVITLQGRVSRELHPTVGVVAGCSLAMAMTKLLYIRILDKYVSTLPSSVSLDTHVDDFTLSAVGPPAQVAADLTRARDDLATVMQSLGCKFAEDKTIVTASSRRLAADLARRIGIAGSVTSAPCLLGVDCTAGATRARLKGTSKKAARLRAALARKTKLRRLHKVIGSRANKIFRAGILPAATYDAPIWGISDAEVTKLRRLAAVAMSPKAPGRSLTRTHLWHGLPTADAENAPVLHYSKMIWKAITRREEAERRSTTVADIRRAWESARNGFEPLAEEVLAARGADGKIPRGVARRIWKQVRGPIGAAAVTLARVGWRFTSPFAITDTDGTEHCLTTASPCLIRDLMRGATRAAMEKAVAASLANNDETFRDRRACLDLAIAASRPGRRHNAQQAAAFRAVACGAIWTAALAKERGYVTDGCCPLGCRVPDTIRHRVYECPHTRDAVRNAVPRWFWDEAQRTGAHTPFWTTGIFPHPADVAPLPRADLRCEVEQHGPNEEGVVDPPGSTEVRGRAYVDGSCIPSVIRGLARASCALVTCTAAGVPIKTLQLPVPRHLPQTSQAAEYLIMAVAFEFLRGTTAIVGDCLNVVKAYAADARKALAPTRKYAGLVASSFKNPAARRDATVSWTRAHRTPTGRESAEEAADIHGNAAADTAAGAAIALHPALGADVEAAVEYHTKRIKHVVAAVAAAMAIFPPAPRDMARAPRPTTIDEARQTRQHLWRWRAGKWRCEACGDYVTKTSVPQYRRRQKCTGRTLVDSAEAYAANGHALIRAEADIPFVMCSHCGAWGNRRARLLRRPCGAPTAAGAQALKRLLRGQHPALQKDGGGRYGPRATASIKAAYDAAAGEWVGLDPPAPDPPEEALEDPIADALMQDAAREQLPTAHGAHAEDSEEDVFGHGGALDQGTTMEKLTADDEIANIQLGGTGAAAASADNTVINIRAPTSSRRRQRDVQVKDTRDYTAAAIDRLGQTLRRSDADATGRMARLRRRVEERAQAARDKIPSQPMHASETRDGGMSGAHEQEPRGTKRPASRDAVRDDFARGHGRGTTRSSAAPTSHDHARSCAYRGRADQDPGHHGPHQVDAQECLHPLHPREGHLRDRDGRHKRVGPDAGFDEQGPSHRPPRQLGLDGEGPLARVPNEHSADTSCVKRSDDSSYAISSAVHESKHDSSPSNAGPLTAASVQRRRARCSAAGDTSSDGDGPPQRRGRVTSAGHPCDTAAGSDDNRGGDTGARAIAADSQVSTRVQLLAQLRQPRCATGRRDLRAPSPQNFDADASSAVATSGPPRHRRTSRVYSAAAPRTIAASDGPSDEPSRTAAHADALRALELPPAVYSAAADDATAASGRGSVEVYSAAASHNAASDDAYTTHSKTAASSQARSVLQYVPADAGHRGLRQVTEAADEGCLVRRRMRGKQKPRWHADGEHGLGKPSGQAVRRPPSAS